ncbi:hypothetical protein SERLA73DRAFT_176502 [Serpula lacrymans var. lacrymans S7.3]|uniref:Cytochrome P450 n=2 Tax=Serpula lacrymans var. lacrymans TaxID=341189 RepID=F8PN30_SERL3|nr:uncharacterized protein SERLADRAFT_459383 [Serpula lacrymans var. lacrymans S7.9]EGO03012.1 hypothetical protein SERLA73DRAFT_176502 [Serpula lacrymans var. lacrymans S7.3]EGO28690.1 hypothetical protein SERLADRAFT_459383 [Serpula lacrymans var. lacrymans S7.9]
MVFFSLILQSTLVCAATALCYFVWHRLVAKHPLDNIPGPPAQSLWKGNMGQVFDNNGWDFHQLLADKFGPVSRFYGLFGARRLYVFDPKAMHHIVVKDQYTYEETPMFLETNKLLFGEGLLSTLGEHHRRQRKLLNPVFSISHMRHMVPIFSEITKILRDAIAEKVQDGPQEINMLDWFTRTALELVGQSGLGYSFDELREGYTNPYSHAVKNMLPTLFKLTIWRQFLPLAVKLSSASFRKRLTDIIPWKPLRELRDIVDIMAQTSTTVFEAKKVALQEGDEAVMRQVGQGRDIISILLKANLEAAEEDRLPESELLAQMSTLIFAAMDTTSGALSRTLQTLSSHPKAQETLRAEIRQARAEKGDLTYDDLVNLPYLDAICRETLRLYPPATMVSRTARKDIILPFSKPVKGVDGREMHEVLVPENTSIIISILASNRNREIWGPDALEWKPERWLSPLPQSVTDAQIPGVYSHLMTFLGGGRACIGFKFSQLEMKMVLSLLIESFKFSPAKEIAWTLGGVSSPRVKGSTEAKLELPIIVESVKA